MIKHQDDVFSPMYHLIFNTSFGFVAMVWSLQPKFWVHRIFLSHPKNSADKKLKKEYADSTPSSCAEAEEIAGRIRQYLEGEAVTFSLDCLRMDQCSVFQQSVLRTEYRIPYGYISTYQRIAYQLSRPKASRAVGNALAGNPYPIIIPCHRAVRSDYTLGGYQGGVSMKRYLLESEGNRFDTKNRLIQPSLIY